MIQKKICLKISNFREIFGPFFVIFVKNPIFVDFSRLLNIFELNIFGTIELSMAESMGIKCATMNNKKCCKVNHPNVYLYLQLLHYRKE